MADQIPCPRCGTQRPAPLLQGLCPECLLKMTLEGPGSSLPFAGTEATASFTPAAGSEDTARATPLPEIGQQFGDYRIVRRLGQGGMGVVYEAEHLASGRRVALKVLSRALDSTEHRRRFLREGRLAASINHPNSVYIFGTEEIEGCPVIAMELVPGGTLQQRVKEHGPLPVAEAVDVVLQIIAGLEAAEAVGVLHRDVKPANCFVDADGSLKIGDFGLSISTAGRDESFLTAVGSILGTPAFASPEQLRGDELSVRSDIYSVGVTLYYLLTGRTPFAADDLVKLLVTVLERPAESPAKYRREIPKGLCAAVLRCLTKDPLGRFKDYGELRTALLPYASTAPTPATLGRRTLAGFVDCVVLTAVAGAAGLITMMATGGSTVGRSTPLQLLHIAVWYLLMILYFALPEGLRGASLGKWLCGVRVTGPDRNVPGVAKAFARASLGVLLPVLPMWIWAGFDPNKFTDPDKAWQMIGMAYSSWVVAALLFCTMRRRNGFAAVHDLLTRTRVIRKPAYQARPVLTTSEPALPTTESLPKVGPYHVLETLEKTDAGEWLLAYDGRLLRKVWLHVVPAGTPPVEAQHQAVGRVGRLRWITGRRSAEENWDAFEGVTGKPLVHLLDKPQPWGLVRYWLLDLATEIAAAEKDGTLPAVLALDRVWITGDGRAKLLDFRAPGAAASTTAPLPVAANEFVNLVARAAVGGGENLRVPLPVHARKFMEKLPGLPTAEAVAAALKPLLHKLAAVTRARRAALLAGCLAAPVLMAGFMIVSATLVSRWQRSQPEITEMTQLLNNRMAMRMGFWPSSQPKVDDRTFAIYIASHYRATITDAAAWHSNYANMMIAGENRLFVEQSLKDYPDPTAKEIEDATAALKLYLPTAEMKAVQESMQATVWFPFVIAGSLLLIWVCIPAMIAALLFRGGLVMLACGVAVVRKDGRPASRGRVFFRSVVAWSPVWFAPILLALLIPLQAMATRRDAPVPRPVAVEEAPVRVDDAVKTAPAVTDVPQAAETTPVVANAPATPPAQVAAEVTEEISSVMYGSGALVALLVLGLTMWSLALPERGLPDRVAGTTLVPR